MEFLAVYLYLEFPFEVCQICDSLCILNIWFAFVSDAIEQIAPELDTEFYVKMI